MLYQNWFCTLLFFLSFFYVCVYFIISPRVPCTSFFSHSSFLITSHWVHPNLSLYSSILIEINTCNCFFAHVMFSACQCNFCLHPSICCNSTTYVVLLSLFPCFVPYFFLTLFSLSLSLSVFLCFYFRNGMPTCLLQRVLARCILLSQTCQRSTTCTASASPLFCASSKELFRPRR